MDPQLIPSLLYKATMLGTTSTYLRGMVQAAARIENVPFTDDLLWHVATDPDVAGAIDLHEGEAIDSALLRVMIANPDHVDEIVSSAVRDYTPPTA